MNYVFYIAMFILGACIGSFLCCQARRLRLHSTKKGTKLGSRSVCLHCHCQLKWYDNLPLISWLFLKGKCRKCHHKIGYGELLSELLSAVAFLLLALTIDPLSATGISWGTFIITLLVAISMLFLAIYDGLYGELPTKYLYISLFLSFVLAIHQAIIAIIQSGFSPNLIYDPLLSVVLLGGLYYLLYKISAGRWVGDGDWLLAAAIGLALSNPWQSLVALFLANFLACLIMLPFMKKKTSHQIYFGPFLVAAFIIAPFVANWLATF